MKLGCVVNQATSSVLRHPIVSIMNVCKIAYETDKKSWLINHVYTLRVKICWNLCLFI